MSFFKLTALAVFLGFVPVVGQSAIASSLGLSTTEEEDFETFFHRLFNQRDQLSIEDILRLQREGPAFQAWRSNDLRGFTALQILASGRDRTERHLQMFEALLDAGANPNQIFPPSAGPMAGRQLIEALISRPNPNQYEVGMFGALLRPGAYIPTFYFRERSFQNLSISLLHYRVFTGNLRGVESAISLLQLLNISIDSPNQRGFTALHLAALRGDLDSVRLLIDRGANPRLMGPLNDTVLHHAIRAYDGSNSQRILEMIVLLIRNGAPLNERNSDGDTPLHIAVRVGFLQVIPTLIAYHAEAGILNNRNETPLELANFFHNRLSENRRAVIGCLQRYAGSSSS